MSPPRDPATSGLGRAFARSWRFRIWLAIFLLAGAALTTVPLFGVLGYELALAMAILGSIAGLDLGAAFARRAVTAAADGHAGHRTETPASPSPVPAPREDGAPARSDSPWRQVLGLARRAVALAVLVVLPPAVIAATNGLRVPTCDWWFGVWAYASLAVASTALAAGLGVALGLATGPRRILGNLAPPLVWLVVAVAGLNRFYAAPPVFTYNPIVGFFPGNLYDEHVDLGAPLAWARLEQLLIVAALLAVATALLDERMLRPRLPRIRRIAARWQVWSTAALLAGGAIALRVNGGALGYTIDAADIQAELSGRLETKHFVIHYARRPEIEADIDLIAADHEFRYAQVTSTLGAGDLGGKIHSYYFADRDQKARWMGARDVEMAKPWRREIYLTHQRFPHRSLRHEIAHVIAGTFGDPWFAVSARRLAGLPVLINPGLIEGLAVAVDWPGSYDRELTPHESVRAMQELGVEPSVGEVFSLQFLSLASSRGYTAAGSFMRFLIDRDGPAAMRRLYETGGDFQAAYGHSQAELVGAWRTMVAAIELPAGAAEAVRERFRRGSVFARPCPHAVAARRDRAIRLAEDGRRAQAVSLLRQVCRDAPEEPRHRLELAELLAGGDDGERTEAEAIWRALIDANDVTTSLRAEALENLGRRAAVRGDWGAAGALFDQGAALPVDDDERRMHEAQAFAVHHRGPAGPFLRGYFFSPGDGVVWSGLAIANELSLGLGWYLRGIQRIELGEHAGGAADLAEAVARGLPSPRFVRSAARRMAVASWRAGDYVMVERAASILGAADQPEIERLLAADWRARIAFARADREQPRPSP